MPWWEVTLRNHQVVRLEATDLDDVERRLNDIVPGLPAAVVLCGRLDEPEKGTSDGKPV